LHDAALSAKMWLNVLFLGISLVRQVGGALDGTDFDVGFCAAFVETEAGDPDLAFAEHGSLRVDEEGVVLLFQDGLGYIECDDAIVVGDESLRRFDDERAFAGVHLDGIVNQGRDACGIVAGDRLLEIGEEMLDLDVIPEQHVDGFVEVGRGGLGAAGARREERTGE
jgi:hypothetical protein